MMIRLTDRNGLGIVLGHQTILVAHRDPATKTVTHVITGISGPRGLMAYEVTESPEQVALMINAAEKSDIQPSLLGLGKFSDVAMPGGALVKA